MSTSRHRTTLVGVSRDVFTKRVLGEKHISGITLPFPTPINIATPQTIVFTQSVVPVLQYIAYSKLPGNNVDFATGDVKIDPALALANMLL